MRHLILLVAVCHVTNAGDLLTVQPAVVQYDVVPQRPALYSAPAVHVATPVIHAQSHINTPYVGTYAVHTTPAVHHNYHHTQTHPIGYAKPVHVYGGSGHYYQPTATSTIHQSRVIVPATSTLHQSHLVVPATNRVYQYRAYDNHNLNQPYTDGQSSFSSDSYGNYGNGGQQFNSNNNNQGYDQSSNGYENGNNGGQVKTRRYQIRRPAIRKEFYDIEEKVIIRPAGSALIELDTPISKTLKTDSYAPAYNNQNQYNAGQAYTPNQNQYNGGQAYPQNQNQYNGGQAYPQNQNQYNGGQTYNPNQNHQQTYTPNPRAINCGEHHHGQGVNQYQPTTTYSTPTTTTYRPTTTYSTPGQYFPTTTMYASTPYGSPTPLSPSRTYQPPYSDQNSNQYHPTTFAPTAESSTPRQTVTPSTANQDVFVSSTTPVSVTIVDTADTSNNNNNNNKNNTQRQDIIYARGQSNYGNNQYNGNEENGPDQFRNELPPRGDVAQTADYRDTDQFYHELPRSRYTGPNQPPAIHVETKYNGEPTEINYYAEEITIGNRGQNSSRNANNSTDDQQQRLIELYTGNGGVSEIGQTGQSGDQNQQQQQPQSQNGRYTNDGSSSYNDVGNVRARVISATPAPEGSVPSEHVNTRRIVVSKRVETVREIEVPENNGTTSQNDGQYNGQNGNYNANYNDGNRQYNDENSNYNNNNNNNNDGRFSNANDNNYNYNANYNDGRSSSNYGNNPEYNNNNNNYNNNREENNANGRTSDTSSRYTGSSPAAPSGYYISTTPASTGKRIIYVKPVTQEFAEQKAVTPAQYNDQRRA